MSKSKKYKPPSLANWLVSKLIKDRLLEEFFGDLEEIYQDRISTKGKVYAWLLYWIDALHLLIGFASFNLFKTQNNTVMFKHYLLVSSRNLARNKVYSLINILGLAVGMGVCLTICQYIYFELSYDTFHENHQNTYRVIIEEVNSDLNDTYPYAGYELGVSAKEEIPEVLQFVRKERCNRGAVVINPMNHSVFHEDINDLLFVDNSFFQVFNFPIMQGNQEAMLEDKYNIVITEETARKYFGSDDPIGKTLKINGPPSPGDYTVTGVLQDTPLNSHLQFDFLMSMENYIEYGWGGAVKKQGGWNGFSVVTYLTLSGSADPVLVSEKLSQMIAQHKREGDPENNIVKKVSLQPIAEIYLKSDSYSDAGFVNATGNRQNIRIFSIISLFILVIAWVNYINLSTARSMQRAKEVGVRKSAGAFRRQLVSQFIIESVLINVVSGMLAIGLAFLALPVLSEIVGKEIELTFMQIPVFWFLFLAIILLGSLLSGLYPAFILSSFKPISMLGSKGTSRTGNVNLRRGLIVFQFLMSLLLISGTYLVYKQTFFMKNQELSIDMEKIMVLRTQQVNLDGENAPSKFQSFRNEMTRHHSISAVTSSSMTPGHFWVSPYHSLRQSENMAPYSRSISGGPDFSNTYGLEFIAGGPFTEDMLEEDVVIVNESAINAFGFASPEAAIQQSLAIGDRQRMIVGVVKNFHWHSLKEPHIPYVIGLGSVRLHPYISVRMNLTDIPASLAYIKAAFHSFFPDQPFEYFFADEAFERQYQSEVQFGDIFLSFTALAIFIGCVGLFALVSYSATLRIKEIGIRKVFGADVGNIMMLLSREYLILLLVATVLAIPVVIYWGSSWLENYAYRIGIGFDLFIIPALALLLISFLTVSHRTYATARANPVDSLRAE